MNWNIIETHACRKAGSLLCFHSWPNASARFGRGIESCRWPTSALGGKQTFSQTQVGRRRSSWQRAIILYAHKRGRGTMASVTEITAIGGGGCRRRCRCLGLSPCGFMSRFGGCYWWQRSCCPAMALGSSSSSARTPVGRLMASPSGPVEGGRLQFRTVAGHRRGRLGPPWRPDHGHRRLARGRISRNISRSAIGWWDRRGWRALHDRFPGSEPA